jgi:hypothetical protein
MTAAAEWKKETTMTLAEAACRDPRLLVLCCVEKLQLSLERNTRNVPCDGQFHVRLRGRIIFSGAFAAAGARFERARAAQLRRQQAAPGRPRAGSGALRRGAGARWLPRAAGWNGRYAGQRRVSWRVLVPLRPPEPCEKPRKRDAPPGS